METIKFRVTTIKPKEHINDFEKQIGSYTGDINSISNYLENIDLNIKKDELCKLSRPIEYAIQGVALNNLCVDWCHNNILRRFREYNKIFHVRIERLNN